MTGLRICMVTTFYPPYSFGGDGIAVQRLSRALVRRGHRVTVVHDVDAFRALHPGEMPSRPDRDDDEGVTVLRLRSRWGVVSPLLVQQCGRPVLHAARLRSLLGPGQWDVVNFHNVSLIGGPGILRYPTDAVTLYMAHEHWLVCPTHVLWRNRRERCEQRQCMRCLLTYRRPPQLWRHTGALRRALAGIDTVVAMSEFSRAKHREMGLEREMEVLPPFLPDDTAPTASADHECLPSGRPWFVFCGRVERMKGLDDVIAAFRTITDAELVIAGTGTEAARLQEATREMPQVRWLGATDPETLRRWCRGAVAAIVPSLGYETFGLVTIEAFREGIPVIARRIGPFPEIIASSGGGLLFDTVEELRAQIITLLTAPGLRDGLARSARAAFEQHYTDDRVVPAYLELIAKAARRRGHPIGHTRSPALAVAH
jgi:glycosyltransferase involved in cell wall biosynthesis